MFLGGIMFRVSFLGRLIIAALVLLHAPWPAPAAPRAAAEAPSTDTDTQPGPIDSESCQRAHARATEILTGLDAKASSTVKAFASSILAKAGTAAPPDVAWDDFAGIAYLRGNPDTALWAEVRALALNWRAEYVAHAGVYLLNLKNGDDAKLFLQCAYDMGWRSVSLFEAMALAHDASNEKDKAKQYIDQAKALNPGDLILQAESSLITTGTLPPVPPRKKDDLDLVLDDLERHFRDVNTRIRAGIQLLDEIRKIVGFQLAADQLKDQDRWESDMRKQIDSIRQNSLPLARISLEEFRKTRFPNASVPFYELYLTSFHDAVIAACAFQYMMITTHEIQSLNYGFWDIDLWARAMHSDVRSYVRQGQATKAMFVGSGVVGPDFSGYVGFIGGYSGLYLDPGASADARYYKARHEADEILKRHPLLSERHAAQVAWCAQMIPAYQDWQASAKSDFQVAADGFNAPAKQLLAWGAAEVADVRGFLNRTMRVYRPITYTPTGNKDEDTIAESYAKSANSYPESLNPSYRGLIDMVAGDPESIFSVIPNRLLSNKRAFAEQEQYSESQLRSAADLLTSDCSPVAADVFKKLNSYEADATREELFNELVESLNAKGEPTSKCEFELGKFASAHIEFDWEKFEVHTEVEAKWDFKKKETKTGEWSLGTGTTTKFDAHGNTIESEVTVGGDVQFDIGRGYVEAGIVAEKDPATGTWKRLAEVKGSFGLGYKIKDFGGVACYPAEVTMKFDPREVRQKAVRFLEAKS